MTFCCILPMAEQLANCLDEDFFKMIIAKQTATTKLDDNLLDNKFRGHIRELGWKQKMYGGKWVKIEQCLYIFTQPLHMSRMSIFNQSLTVLNSEFSFSLTSCHNKVKEPVCLDIYPKVLALCEMQTTWIWTQVAMSISYNDNHYTISASKNIFNLLCNLTLDYILLLKISNHYYCYIYMIVWFDIDKDWNSNKNPLIFPHKITKSFILYTYIYIYMHNKTLITY